jgi:hypothetical protein
MGETSHIKKAKSNEKFRSELCHCFEDQFFDWKVTVCFYEAIHWLRALAHHRKKEIGRTHIDIKKNIDPKYADATMVIEAHARKAYEVLHKNSQSARYDSYLEDEDENEVYGNMFKHSEENLKQFKGFIDKQKLDI